MLGEEHMAAGMPNLTPDPPALPGAQHPNEAVTHHPAQPAAKQMVKNHSDGQLNGTQQSQSIPATGSAAAGASSTTGPTDSKPPMAESRKWYQGRRN